MFPPFLRRNFHLILPIGVFVLTAPVLVKSLPEAHSQDPVKAKVFRDPDYLDIHRKRKADAIATRYGASAADEQAKYLATVEQQQSK